MSQLLQILDVEQVEFVGNTFPDELGGVWLFQRHSINAAEDETCVHKVFHKSDDEALAIFFNVVTLTVIRMIFLDTKIGIIFHKFKRLMFFNILM